jgi:putative ABC transport system permease protein
MKRIDTDRQNVSPPRLARLILSIVLPASEREFFMGDLHEEFQRQAAGAGLRKARQWYWKEAIRAPGWWRRTSPDFAAVHAEAGKGEVMLSIVQDVRYAFRSLTKSSSLVVFALAALALGIGANTAVFSIVNGVLLKPLPYAEPQQLVRVWDSNAAANLPFFSVAHGNLLEWEKQNTVFTGIGAYREDGFSFSNSSIQDMPERVTGARITAGLLPVLGVSPALGRWFTPDEDRPGADRVVVLSHDLWRRKFSEDRGVIGKDVRIEGERHMVVGIMPADFRLPIEGSDLWIPYALDRSKADRGSHFLRVLGRLKPTSTIEQARAELNRIAERLEENDPATRKGWRVNILPMDESVTRTVGPTLWMMLGTVGLVLLIASANVANLLLARSVSRRKEISLRLSLGASRSRLLRQLLTESLVLSFAGGLLGIGVAVVALDVLKSQAPGNIPRLTDISIAPQVLLFNAVVSIATGLLFGIVPALRGSRVDLSEGLKVASHGSTTARRDRRAGRLLVVAQITIAMVVVISSGLMLRTLWNLHGVDPGFQTDGRYTFGINLNGPKYAKTEARVQFMTSIIEQIRSLPGVQNVAATHRLPMTGNSGVSIEVEDQPAPQSGQNPTVTYRSVTPDYFDVMGIPLVRGRTFDSRESQGGSQVVVINQRMAARFWPGQDPIGKRIRNGPKEPWIAVVGLVADSKENRLDIDTSAGMYLPYPNMPIPAMTVVVQLATGPSSIADEIRQEIRRLDADIGIGGITPLEDVVSASIGQRSFTAALLTVFAGISLLLAASGLYGVLAYAVNQRVREIGVRMALGASRRTVLRHIINDGLRLILPGIAAGTVGALAATRLLSDLLFGVKAVDPVTFAAIAAFLTLIGILACYIPARKAASVDPLAALRNE